MNETETRLLLLQASGKRFSRQTPLSELQNADLDVATGVCAQAYKRKMLQSWLTRNWTYVQESLSCEGDCASEHNKCSDAQAHTCYSSNKDKVDND